MKLMALVGTAVVAASTLTLPALAQGDRISVPVTDPARPVTVNASLVTGNIRVRGYAGKEVIVEAKPATRARDNDRGRDRDRDRDRPEREGLRRIPINTTGLEAEEENNVVKISAASHARAIDLEIQVPTRSSLQLKTINDGEIVVEGVQGDVDVSNINGPVTLTGISGSAVAHALNGKIKVVFNQVDGSKPMSFSSMNGDIDVAFPASLKANIKMKTRNGEVFSDFDLNMNSTAKPVVETNGTNGRGKYRVQMDSSVYGTVNGGGPEIQFSNFNGSIYIRKGK